MTIALPVCSCCALLMCAAAMLSSLLCSCNASLTWQMLLCTADLLQSSEGACPDHQPASLQLLCIFDADMLPKPEFFMKMLPELNDPRVALVLSPQSFHNYNPRSDIFNHSNFTYWEYILPGQQVLPCSA